jgi:hypothetical protein
MRETQGHRFKIDNGREIGLGWHIARKYEAEIIWHNGGTGGYHSFAGFNPKTQLGAVVLSNSATNIDDIGFHLLESRNPLSGRYAAKRKQHTAVQVDPRIYEAYVGEYALNTDGFSIKISKEGKRLMTQCSGQEKVEFLPESETEFFSTVNDACIEFEKNAAGETTGLILHQNGEHTLAPKKPLKGPRATKGVQHTAVQVDPRIYDAYAGSYELVEGDFFIAVSRDGDRLMTQCTGQGKTEFRPEAENEFFSTVNDACITFVKNAAGETTGLVLHQLGMDRLAPKKK